MISPDIQSGESRHARYGIIQSLSSLLSLFFKDLSDFHIQRTIFKCNKVLFSEPSIINIQKPQLEHCT